MLERGATIENQRRKIILIGLVVAALFISVPIFALASKGQAGEPPDGYSKAFSDDLPRGSFTYGE